MWRNSQNLPRLLQPLLRQIFEKLLAEMKKIHSFLSCFKKIYDTRGFSSRKLLARLLEIVSQVFASELVEISENSSCGSFCEKNYFMPVEEIQFFRHSTQAFILPYFSRRIQSVRAPMDCASNICLLLSIQRDAMDPVLHHCQCRSEVRIYMMTNWLESIDKID